MSDIKIRSTAKDDIWFKFKAILSSKFKRTEIDDIGNAFFVALNDYEIKEKSTELVVADSSDAKAIQLFFIAKNVEGCTQKTLRSYRGEIERFLTYVNKPLKNITTNDIRVYIAKSAIDRGISKITQDNNLRILRSFFAWLNTEEIIERNPTLKIKKIRAEKKEKKAFTEIEIEKLRVEVGDNKRNRAIMDFLLSTGCRVGEIVGLNIEDIKGDECIVFGKGKKERTVYLNAKAIVSLEEYLKERTDDNPALFVSEFSPYKRLEIPGIELMIRKIGRKAGVPDTHPHRFRRTAATLAIRRGMPIELVKAMLGHNGISTTMIYIEMAKDSLKENHKKYVV